MKCSYIKDGGEQCNGNATTESVYCYWHNPDVPETEKQLARTKGGQNKIIAIGTPLTPIRIKSGRDVTVLLEQTINDVRAGDMDPRIANTIGYLAGHLIKAIEVGDTEKRITAIEQVISGN